MAWRIHPLVLGSKLFDKGMMTYQHDYGAPYAIPIYGWLLLGGDKIVLVDTGETNPIRSPDREAALGGKIHTIEEALAQFSLTPADVQIVLHTHLHADHCENDYKCLNAEIIVHEKELERLQNPHPLDYRYFEEHLDEPLERGQVRTINPGPEPYEILPGLRVRHTPAHTEGGLSVYIDVQGGTVAITGFCVIDENLHPPKKIAAMGMDVIPPGTVVDACKAYDILCEVKASADCVIPLHEPKFAAVETIDRV